MRSRRNPARALAVVIALVAIPSAASEDDSPRLEVGRELTGRLDAGSRASFRLVPASDGPLVVELRSHDFDAFLQAFDATGARIAEADGGGVETDARLALDGRAGAPIEIRAGSRRPGEGEFRILLSRGDAAPARPVADARIAFRTTAAERAVARDDAKAAMAHLEAAAAVAQQASLAGPCRDVLGKAIAIARERGLVQR